MSRRISRVLQSEGGRVVVLEGDGRTIRKSFPAGAGGAEQAATEFARLSGMHRALEHLPGMRCPRPLEVYAGHRPALTMEFAPGIPMAVHLGSPSLPYGFLEWLGALLVVAVERYVQEVGEPLYDLHFRNMLFDVAHQEVVLLDLGDPDTLAAPFRAPGALDACALSVVGLAGSTLFECVRPAHLLRLRSNVNTLRAARAALVVLSANAGSFSSGAGSLNSEARNVCRHLTQGGSRLRRSWYGTVGRLLAFLYGRIMLVPPADRST